MRRAWLPLLILLSTTPIGLSGPPQIISPAWVWSAVWRDLQSLPPNLRAYTRYLSLANIPADQRERWRKVLTGHVNGLSTEPDLVSPVLVDGVLLRLNYLDYGWKSETWEKLASADPYFHVRLEIRTPWPGGQWRDGKSYPAKSFDQLTYKGAPAPWITTSPAETAYIFSVTQSGGPLLRADWFLSETAIQEGKTVGYYGMLNIKSQKDFERIIRFNEELAAKLEHRRVVIFSGITLQARRVERTNSVLGGVWRTFDSADAVDKHNPIRILDNLEFDATEQFAPLPNGMPAFLLANNKGVTQTHAPDNVVGGDRTSPSNDTRLHVGLSCWRCHYGDKEHGVKDIAEVPIGRLAAVDYEKLREIRRQYLRQLGPAIDSDRAGFEGSVRAATGFGSAAEYAANYGAAFSAYVDGKVSASVAANDCGVTAERLVGALRVYDSQTGLLDPVLSILANGGAIPIRQAEEIHPKLQEILAGSRP